jgi:hypothetical protein
MTLAPSTRASLLLRLRDSQDRGAWVEFVSLYEHRLVPGCRLLCVSNPFLFFQESSPCSLPWESAC